VLDTYNYESLKALGGHEVVSSDGEKLGYNDLVFRDVDTGVPEWLGIWDGLPDRKPRQLVPVRRVEVDEDVVRVPWPAEVVRSAPDYERHGDLIAGGDEVIDITPETERIAYEHYGIDPLIPREEDPDAVRFRVWVIQELE
jgi:hypothetical protein